MSPKAAGFQQLGVFEDFLLPHILQKSNKIQHSACQSMWPPTPFRAGANQTPLLSDCEMPVGAAKKLLKQH